MFAGPVPAGTPQVIYLVWENHNDPAFQIYIITDIWSSTNLSLGLAGFKHKLFVPPLVNSVQIMATNQQEFFIARFAETNLLEWNYSEWSHD